MASGAGQVCGPAAWLLAIAVVLAGGPATRAAQPEPRLPAAVKPAVEGDDAAPDEADKPAAQQPAGAKRAAQISIAAPEKAVVAAEAAPAAPAVAGPAPAEAKKEKAQPNNDQFEANLLRAAAAKKAAGVKNAQALAIAQQWRPTLVVELSFIRLICPGLTPRQRVVVKAAGEQALVAAADAATGVQRGVITKRSTPQAMIRDALSDALHEVLPDDKWEQFAAESEARTKRRQSAVIRLVVEHVDEALYLRQEQRDQISHALADRWQPAWESWLQMRYARNLPVMPDEVVTPYLDADQKQAWQKIPKVQFGFNAVNVNNGNAGADAMAWWDEAAPAGPKGADVPPP
jgi:hypothetical protein